MPVLIMLFLFCTTGASAQKDSFRQKINKIIRSVDGAVGVAVMHSDKMDTLTVNGHSRFPMQSVYKFPLGLAVLHKVDKGEFSLQQKIHIGKDELHPNTWSPLAKKYPQGNVDVALEEILQYTVSESDNNGCDILFRMIGGPAKVQEYIRQLGINDMSILNTEEEMSKGWDIQFDNWSTPVAMMRLLEMFHKKNILTSSSGEIMQKWLVGTPTGPRRIKGLLPAEIIVAHKTGTGGQNDPGVIPALNDVGVVTLPDGTHFIIAVFISNSVETPGKLEQTIAEISRAAFEYYR